MVESIYIKAARQVLKEGGFRVRNTHNGFEIRDDYTGRHLHTLTCRDAARAEVERLNAQGPRLVWENSENRWTP